MAAGRQEQNILKAHFFEISNARHSRWIKNLAQGFLFPPGRPTRFYKIKFHISKYLSPLIALNNLDISAVKKKKETINIHKQFFLYLFIIITVFILRILKIFISNEETSYRGFRSKFHFAVDRCEIFLCRLSDSVGPVCPQKLPDISNEQEALERMPKGRLEYLKRLLPHLRNQSEDCLYLNIYAPAMGE